MSTTKIVKKEAKASEVKESSLEDSAVMFEHLAVRQSDLSKLAEQFRAAKGRLEAAGKAAMEQGILKSRVGWLGSAELAADSKQVLQIARTLYKQNLISKGDALALSRYVTLKRTLEMLTDGDLIK